MKTVGRTLFAFTMAAFFLTGCATQFGPPPAFNAQPISDGQYDKKVDQLVFILDASYSMSEVYQGYRKLDIARGVVENFNATMPDVDVIFSLYSFGHAPNVSTQSSALMIKPRAYMEEVVNGGLKKFTAAGGSSPLGRPIKDASVDLKAVKGPIAMVIVSDGKELSSSPLGAAKALAADHADVCIYTVQAGDDKGGRALLQSIAAAASCGNAVNAGDLASGGAMADFVKEVLLTKKNDSDGDGVADDKDRCPNTPRGVKVDMNGCPLDSDGDGVLDYKDQCPGTPSGTKVDAVGCPIPAPAISAAVTAAGTYLFKEIQFETNKSVLKESSYPSLQEITAALKAEPDLNIEIQGHTDSAGGYDYNVGLSQRRAESVKAYLVSQGIAASRMTSKGFGPDRPIATNATKQGRAQNRRVEIKPIQ